MDGPVLRVNGKSVKTCATDPWGAIGQMVSVSNSVWDRKLKGSSQMKIMGYTPQWKWGREVAPAYFLDCVKAEHSGHLYAFPPSDVYSLLPDAFTAALEAADEEEEEYDDEETDVGPPPPVVLAVAMPVAWEMKLCMSSSAPGPPSFFIVSASKLRTR